MSTLNVSNITDGTDTVETSYVVNGSAKAWVSFNGKNTATIQNSLNISSMVDQGTGQYLFTVINAFANANSAFSSATGNRDSSNAGTGRASQVGTSNTTTFHYELQIASTNTNADAEAGYVTVDGDLA